MRLIILNIVYVLLVRILVNMDAVHVVGKHIVVIVVIVIPKVTLVNQVMFMALGAIMMHVL